MKCNGLESKGREAQFRELFFFFFFFKLYWV
jgi:hypothetical protein